MISFKSKITFAILLSLTIGFSSCLFFGDLNGIALEKVEIALNIQENSQLVEKRIVVTQEGGATNRSVPIIVEEELSSGENIVIINHYKDSLFDYYSERINENNLEFNISIFDADTVLHNSDITICIVKETKERHELVHRETIEIEVEGTLYPVAFAIYHRYGGWY